MSRYILLASLCVVLAACGRTVVRETVVEKQPVVTRETVVERPVAPPATVVAPSTVVAVPGMATACSLGTAAYSHGTLSCLSGRQYECVEGVWQPLPGSSC